MSSQCLTDEHKSPHTATCVYETKVDGSWRNVTIVWEKTHMNHSLDISIDSVASESHPNHKIDLKPWCFWAKKGCKTIEVDGYQIDLYWDFRSAIYLGSLEPSSDFYVALIHKEEVVLLLGDMKEKVYRKTQTHPSEVEGAMVFKKEHVFGKKSFITRGKFDPNGKDCEIVVERSVAGSKEPAEMSISADGTLLIHVKNLQWKFRGNQTVLINKQPIEIFWDVHGWFFSGRGSNHGLFLFKPGQQESDSDRDDDRQGGTGEKDKDKDKECKSDGSSTNLQLCLILYAWMSE